MARHQVTVKDERASKASGLQQNDILSMRCTRSFGQSVRDRAAWSGMSVSEWLEQAARQFMECEDEGE